MKHDNPEDYNYEDIKQYTVELNEVTARMDDQRFVLQNGIVVTTKSLIVDFINFLNFFSHNQRRMSTKIIDLENSVSRHKNDNREYKERNEQLVRELRQVNETMEVDQERIKEQSAELDRVRDELSLLKKTTRGIDQKRTIQK